MKKGQATSEATKQLLSAATKRAWDEGRLGKPDIEQERIATLRATIKARGVSPLKGRKQTPEHVAARTEKARLSWTPERRAAHAELMKKLYQQGRLNLARGLPALSDEHKAAIAEANRRRVFTDAMRANARRAHLGRTRTEDTRRQISERMRAKVVAGTWQNPMTLPHDTTLRRQRLSMALRGKPKTAAHREALAAANRRRAQDPEAERARIAASVKGSACHPNRLERDALECLVVWRPEAGWKFNDGVLVGRKVADLVRSDGVPIMVDLHGDYWHHGEDPSVRINVFKQYGVVLVVVWEHEFRRDPNILIEKVRDAEQEYYQQEVKGG